MDAALLVGLLAAGIRLSMAIAFAALGETVAQRAGVLNVGIEGIMLVGAFLAALGSVWTGSPWGGAALAILGGIAMASVHGIFAVILRVDQIVSGIALVVLGLGLSGFGYRLTIGAAPVPIPAFQPFALGPFAKLPVLGPILFDHTPLVYLSVVSAAAIAFVMQRTALGLELRAIGENPAAADAAGINVAARRFSAVLFGGAMAGLGGAYLAIAQINSFVENMVLGRGFIAIACVVFGRWHPIGVLAAALAFGLAEASQIRFQTWYPNVPYQFFIMLPYVLAVVALIFVARGSAMPKALAKPFSPSRTTTRVPIKN
jgi:general nucleoside transport system permease protein